MAKTVIICRPYITLRNGRKIYASDYGKEAFCFPADPTYWERKADKEKAPGPKG